ncbi:hypothetical protein [Natronoglycomyces albus]|uniref:Uncharacterized protein n=1 Tax=Natronoglycomyces albus TaxID=2811108 RepID=A0A895XT55_9ACTN|nr:hypothetical protein [Natronoglycomyces albus]QSB06455.1 hypothetical protein JQS30_06015 [Natronoglycomyces albus]
MRTTTDASAALNLAALIASDIGVSDLARRMCWQQFDAFASTAPLNEETTHLAMEPVINLARLAIRDGNGDEAYRILHQALKAVSESTACIIDSVAIDFATFFTNTQSRMAARQRLWIALLSDGTRALTRAGRWTEALHAVEQHNGVGRRLLDGRQTAIIGHYTAGNTAAARAMIASAQALTPWERALASFLDACCADAEGTANPAAIDSLTDQYQSIELPDNQSLFNIRLGLSILELATDHGDTKALTDRLRQQGLDTDDAYAARDLTASAHFRASVPQAVLTQLEELVARAGLNSTPREQALRSLKVAFDAALVQLLRNQSLPSKTDCHAVESDGRRKPARENN